MKPRIFKSSLIAGFWCCGGSGWIGTGSSPKTAYRDWCFMVCWANKKARAIEGMTREAL